MDIFEIPQESPHGFFAMLTLNNTTYVCPGWHKVPLGTKREQIKLINLNPTPIQKVKPTSLQKVFKVEGSKPGTIYDVKVFNGNWTCNCPASKWSRSECKHIRKLKEFEKIKA